MKNKKKVILALWLSIFVFFTCLVFFVIGCNSDLLVNKFSKIIALCGVILSFVAIILSIVLLVKSKHVRSFKKVKKVIVSAIVSIYAVGCLTFLFLLYGPYTSFREWLITTAMATMNHKHYCQWFYDDDVINQVLEANTITDVGENTDPTLIDHFVSTDNNNYANDYERQILEHDPDDLYKLIQFKVNDCDAYLAVIYDPSKISVGLSRKLYRGAGQYVYTMAKEQNAVVAINGGGFNDPNHNSKGGDPIGITISDGKIITDKPLRGYSMIGFNKDNTLVLMKGVTAQEAIDLGVRDAVTMSPLLIVNGKSSFIKGNGGWGYAARTAIGQRKDGIVLLLVVDSNEFRTKGASMRDLTEIMENYGAVNAANLDGGTSSVMAINGEMINDPIDSTLAHKTRGIPTIFKVVE